MAWIEGHSFIEIHCLMVFSKTKENEKMLGSGGGKNRIISQTKTKKIILYRNENQNCHQEVEGNWEDLFVRDI